MSHMYQSSPRMFLLIQFNINHQDILINKFQKLNRIHPNNSSIKLKKYIIHNQIHKIHKSLKLITQNIIKDIIKGIICLNPQLIYNMQNYKININLMKFQNKLNMIYDTTSMSLYFDLRNNQKKDINLNIQDFMLLSLIKKNILPNNQYIKLKINHKSNKFDHIYYINY